MVGHRNMFLREAITALSLPESRARLDFQAGFCECPLHKQELDAQTRIAMIP